MNKQPLWALAVSGVLLRCGGTAPQANPLPAAKAPAVEEESLEGLLAGERAYALGDPYAAARILDAVPTTDPSYFYARELLTRAQSDIDAIVAAWIDGIDKDIKVLRYRTALDRAQYMLEHFPLQPAQKEEVAKRKVQVENALVAAQEQLKSLDRQVVDEFLRNDVEGALKTLRQAQMLGQEVDPQEAFSRQRTIDATEQRLKLLTASKQESEKTMSKGKPPKKKKVVEKEKEKTPVPEPVPPEEPKTPAVDPRVPELLRIAAAMQSGQKYFNAIVAYRRVRELDAANAAARVALESLEPKRQQLIKDYLEIANQHFLKQDLASAKPYFEKVKMLAKDDEPAKERAQEGLEMYYNLERIRRGNK